MLCTRNSILDAMLGMGGIRKEIGAAQQTLAELSGPITVEDAGTFEFLATGVTGSEKGLRADVIVRRRGGLTWPASVRFRTYSRSRSSFCGSR